MTINPTPIDWTKIGRKSTKKHKQTAPYLFYNAETGEYFESYFSDKYYQSLFVYRVN